MSLCPWTKVLKKTFTSGSKVEDSDSDRSKYKDNRRHLHFKANSDPDFDPFNEFVN